MSPGPWGYVLLRFVALLAAAVLFGWLFGHFFAWLSAFLLAYLGWHLWHLWQLESWLRKKLGEPPRDAPGLWGEVYGQLYRIRLQSRARKKRLARVLKEFRKSTKALPDAGVVIGSEREIVWLNRAAEVLLGLRREDRGQRIDNLWRVPEFVEFLKNHAPEEVLKIGAPRNKDFRLAIQLVPYGDNQRLLLARDITHATRLENIRRTFVANASHELRSPLTVISGYLDELVEEPGLADHWHEPVQEMVRQSQRMRSIIDDMLTLSRLEAAGPEAGRDRVDVCGLLAGLRKEALARPRRPAVVELQLESAAALWGAESEIYSACANIIGNALKYTPPEGSVQIRWYVEDGSACLSVSDTGLGIPAEAIPRLTERFYRVDKGRDRATGGTGLGLAIVKHVLQRHDARLEVESELGEGTTFTCRFPADRTLL